MSQFLNLVVKLAVLRCLMPESQIRESSQLSFIRTCVFIFRMIVGGFYAIFSYSDRCWILIYLYSYLNKLRYPGVSLFSKGSTSLDSLIFNAIKTVDEAPVTKNVHETFPDVNFTHEANRAPCKRTRPTSGQFASIRRTNRTSGTTWDKSSTVGITRLINSPIRSLIDRHCPTNMIAETSD